MHRVSIAVAFLLASNAAIGGVSNDKLFLRCSNSGQTNIVVDIQLYEDNKGVATLVLDDTRQSGVVLSNEYFYHISFTATEVTHKSFMSINRYTGYFKWEIGEDPFGDSSTENIFHSGTCEAAHRKF